MRPERVWPGLMKLAEGLNKLVEDECYDSGLLTVTTSIYLVLRFIPALILTEEEVDTTLGVMKATVEEVASSALAGEGVE